jgi:hypothetical protein
MGMGVEISYWGWFDDPSILGKKCSIIGLNNRQIYICTPFPKFRFFLSLSLST